jgi:DNA-binding NtrC family response regulator
MSFPWQIVIASTDLESRRELATILNHQGVDPVCTSSVEECRNLMATEDVGLLFCDRNLADGNYRDVLAAARMMKTKVRLVVTSRHPEWDEYLEAMRIGAFDVIASEPLRPTDVEWMLLQARRDERRRMRESATQAAREMSRSGMETREIA